MLNDEVVAIRDCASKEGSAANVQCSLDGKRQRMGMAEGPERVE
jgi:hypothetical protein